MSEPPDEIVYVDESGNPEEDLVQAPGEGESRRVGPKQRPGPNDELPPLMTARDLLEEDDPLTAIPSEPPDEETPPDDTAPPFIIERNKYGPGAHGMYVRDGRSIGNWLNEEHHDLDGGAVAEMLVVMGLDGDLAAWFGIQRDKRIMADAQIAAHPAIQKSMAHEKVRLAQKAAIQEAFIKSQQKKK